MMMTKHAMSNLAPDPPAKPVDERAHEPGVPVGRKDRDRASDKPTMTREANPKIVGRRSPPCPLLRTPRSDLRWSAVAARVPI